MLKFESKNLITATNVPFKTIVWEYICWTLSGKPEIKKKHPQERWWEEEKAIINDTLKDI